MLTKLFNVSHTTSAGGGSGSRSGTLLCLCTYVVWDACEKKIHCVGLVRIGYSKYWLCHQMSGLKDDVWIEMCIFMRSRLIGRVMKRRASIGYVIMMSDA